MPESPYLGDITMVGFNFAPPGYLMCSGQLLPIGDEFDALFTLIGTTFGGDGVQTFALPDLRGRIPVHQGSNQQSNWILGEVTGSETVTLSANQIPGHNHALQASANAGTSVNAAGNVLAAPRRKLYDTAATAAQMASSAIGMAGGSQPHPNLQPFLCVNFIICVQGIFPPQP